MINMKVLESAIDSSVNFVLDAPDGGKFEARYVRRCPEYFIIYLSSHSGCNKACRMCHLTSTRQTMMTEATAGDFIRQAGIVFSHYDSVVDYSHGGAGAEPLARRVNFNWMARGEPLANSKLKEHWTPLHANLTLRASWRQLAAHFHVSTIMPAGHGLENGLSWLQGDNITLYYSLYSMDRTFRKRWLPKAMPVREALSVLEHWQFMTGGDVVLHGPFIRGENDGISDVQDICHAVMESKLRVKRFNQVAYNPPNEKSCEAAPETIEKLLTEYRDWGIHTQQVPRVGLDVKASCGMFVNQAEGED